MNGERKYIGGVDFKELRAQRITVYDTITLNLSTARTDEELEFVGTYLYAIDASDILATVSIRLNEQFRKQIAFQKGRGVRAPFYRLYISNSAQAGKSITLVTGVESETFEIIDSRSSIEITGGIRLGGTNGASAYAQVSITTTATLIKAANSNRRSILVQNLDPTNDLYIGYDNAVTTANGGHVLKPFSAIELYSQGTIYGIRAAGSGNAGYLEENNA